VALALFFNDPLTHKLLPILTEYVGDIPSFTNDLNSTEFESYKGAMRFYAEKTDYKVIFPYKMYVKWTTISERKYQRGLVNP
jgi:hypothetical protein